MYIWVVLAMFITAIYGYNLHYRTDVREVRQAPMAEAITSRVLIQHKALQGFIRGNLNTRVKNATNEVLSFSDDLSPFAPEGFNFTDDITSQVFCLDRTNIDTAVACNSAIATGYTISYMPVPARWLNKRSKQPKTELKNAIEYSMGTRSNFGYNIPASSSTVGINPDTYKSDYEIKNNNIIRTFIPEIIALNDDFTAQCRSGIPCIVYITVEF